MVTFLITTLKVFASIFLLGMFLGGAARAAPSMRNPDIANKVEVFVGAVGVISFIVGMYYLWFN